MIFWNTDPSFRRLAPKTPFYWVHGHVLQHWLCYHESVAITNSRTNVARNSQSMASNPQKGLVWRSAQQECSQWNQSGCLFQQSKFKLYGEGKQLKDTEKASSRSNEAVTYRTKIANELKGFFFFPFFKGKSRVWEGLIAVEKPYSCC